MFSNAEHVGDLRLHHSSRLTLSIITQSTMRQLSALTIVLLY